MKKQKSEQAQVAAIIKKTLKARGIECRTRSESFAGGDAVSVKLSDVPADTLEDIRKEFEQYQRGHFNGMEDIYEYSNSRDDIPQTKYLSIECDYSDEVNQAAWDWFKSTHNHEDISAAPDNAADLNHYNGQIFGHYASQILWRVVNGSIADGDNGSFWDHWRKTRQNCAASPTKTDKPEPAAEPGPDSLAVSVRLNPDKNGLEVEFNDKPPAATRDKLKAAGFRWSRRLGYWYAKQTAEALALAELLRPDHESLAIH